MPPTTELIRTLVIDDEPMARKTLHLLLRDDSDMEIIGDCSNGAEAIEAVKKLQPDLIFLDVQMPEMDGFEVLRHIGPPVPCVVFVTAYDAYALRAFEVHAADYLLKPFDDERFARMLARVKSYFRDKKVIDLSRRMTALLQHHQVPRMRDEAPGSDRLAVKENGRVIFLNHHDIDWIEAADQYVKLHVGDQSHLLRESMGRIEERLPASLFVRIHRSAIVNVGRVKSLQPQFKGDAVLELYNGARLKLSRTRREQVQKRLGLS